jgi:cyclopropane fatty-acyl-phospholipid synthase-like methyltransferase
MSVQRCPVDPDASLPIANIYVDDTYLAKHPTWHEQDSPWKAAQALRMIRKHRLPLKTIAEIGCGVGAILKTMQNEMEDDVVFHGYDISPQAIERAKTLENGRLQFHCEDLLVSDESFDLLLMCDVIEHVPDYLGFLNSCRQKAAYKLYHIPLALHVSGVLRGAFTSSRETCGHIHYFSAESALNALEDTGHQVMDWFYTKSSLELGSKGRFKRTLANLPRRAVGAMSQKWAARLLGGYSMMVLSK